MGGGVLRFFGIHIIAIFALLEFKIIKKNKIQYKCKDEPVIWEIIVKNKLGVSIEFKIDIKSEKINLL